MSRPTHSKMRTGLSALTLLTLSELASAQLLVAATVTADEAYRKGKEFDAKQAYVDAMHWYRIAAEQGNALAEVAVGNLYGQGNGIPQNYAEALRWYRMAAEQGNSEAENDVGLFYLMGIGVAVNYDEAVPWLRKAAQHGNSVAQRNLGLAYLQGLGVPQDRAEAIHWLRQAAGHGDEDAKSALESLGAQSPGRQ